MGEKELVAVKQVFPSVSSAEETIFVRDSGREKTFKKIESFLEQNKKSVLNKHAELWASYFITLSKKRLRIHKGQLKQLDNEDLKYVDELVQKRLAVGTVSRKYRSLYRL